MWSGAGEVVKHGMTVWERVKEGIPKQVLLVK